MSNAAHTIYSLALNEVAQLGDAYWRRVPGGWIVTDAQWIVTAAQEIYGLPDVGPILDRRTSVFVPFSDEFQLRAEFQPLVGKP